MCITDILEMPTDILHRLLQAENLTAKKNDVLPEHNQNMDVIPQILTNKSEEFCYIASRLKEYYGYEEVNLNLGCPSGTVVAKTGVRVFLPYRTSLTAF